MPTVLITGAASGIGRAAAMLFAGRGWQCMLVDRDAQALAALLPVLPSHGGQEHISRVADLTCTAEIFSLADPALPLDAVINNAGMSDTSGLPLIQQDSTQLERLLALNLQAPAYMVEALSAQLVPRARIVNVASGAGLHAIPWRGAYSASKAGLIAQTRALAKARPEWRVSVLCPGFVRTELVDELIAGGRLDPATAVAKIPLGRMAQPQEMAQALFFLASAEAAPLSGECISIDGGSAVFGGSKAFLPSVHKNRPLDAKMSLRLFDCPDVAWEHALLERQPDAADKTYAATIDFSALKTDTGQLLRAVHRAAVRYAQCNKAGSSLTLLLPAEKHDETAWQTGSDRAAARMLVATLACELGPSAMRVNAIEMAADSSPAALAPVVRFVAGAGAQFLTGQIISANAALAL
ncbi:SDR family NAD(P)-dependent oxidoreductase [Advenella alkanexedens]|uniref:SDR family NAD(P)-dependent oxidoreductase n=1 Tax=Advenella alkanexedens TaxID=1481665 RepID=UPI0026743D12|nr:SDR family oxidoreductase [Advenella alkanexedens]WKU20055.1 SDR family oxidoreductase [Advenella alkanexedens]